MNTQKSWLCTVTCDFFSADEKRMNASMIAAESIWGHKSTYRGRMIPNCAEEYMEHGNISIGSQGKHSNRVSVLDDNDIKRKMIEWIRGVVRPKRNLS